MTNLKDIPITSIVRVSPKEGFEKQALDWFYSIAEKASRFDRHLGSEIFKAFDDNPQKEFVSIFHFNTYENLMKWENAEERIKQVALGKEFFHQVKPRLQLTGQFWFENKNEKGNLTTPVKWKMLVITIATIFILLNTVTPLFQKLFREMGLAELLQSLLSVIILVYLLTYVIMPFVTKLLSSWLFNAKNM